MFKALSSRAQDPCNNNETLETLGDAALKALTIANLYVNNPEQDEGWMTTQKSRLVSNESLGECVNRTVAVFYLKDKYNKSKHFVPPMLKPIGEKEEVAAGQDDHMIIARKMLADCFEATVGAALVSTRRLFEPMLVIKKFGVLPRFNLRQYPGWLEWEFPKELEINYLIDCPLFNRDSTLGDVLSVSYCEDIFSVPPGIIYRANRDNDLDYAKRFPLKDFNNGVTKLQRLKESKQKQFANDKAQFLARQQEVLRLTQTEYLGSDLFLTFAIMEPNLTFEYMILGILLQRACALVCLLLSQFKRSKVLRPNGTAWRCYHRGSGTLDGEKNPAAAGKDHDTRDFAFSQGCGFEQTRSCQHNDLPQARGMSQTQEA